MDPKYNITDFDGFTAGRHTWGKLIRRENTPILSIRYRPGVPPVMVFEGETADIAPDNELIQHVIAAIVQLMQDQCSEVTSFLTTIGDPALQEIAKRLHGVVINQIQYFQLQKSVADQQNIDRWVNNQAITTGQVSLSMHDYVPEQLYAPVAALMTELMNDIIREDNQQKFAETATGLQQKIIHFKETGVSMPLFLLSDRENRLIGLSFALVPCSTIAKQELTGIVGSYRGRHLAYYLKALAIREIFRRYPHIHNIETNCYSVNQPIIHINEILGYRLTSSASQYRIERAGLIDRNECRESISKSIIIITVDPPLFDPEA